MCLRCWKVYYQFQYEFFVCFLWIFLGKKQTVKILKIQWNLSINQLIPYPLPSNSLFWPPTKNSSCFGTSPLPIFDKISVSSGMGNSFFFDRLLDQEIHHNYHPLPLERALKAVLINEDHSYQGLVFYFWYHHYYIICLIN